MSYKTKSGVEPLNADGDAPALCAWIMDPEGNNLEPLGSSAEEEIARTTEPRRENSRRLESVFFRFFFALRLSVRKKSGAGFSPSAAIPVSFSLKLLRRASGSRPLGTALVSFGHRSSTRLALRWSPRRPAAWDRRDMVRDNVLAAGLPGR
jgi:hypothetical protein